jgi:hypothetical protein
VRDSAWSGAFANSYRPSDMTGAVILGARAAREGRAGTGRHAGPAALRTADRESGGVPPGAGALSARRRCCSTTRAIGAARV